MIRPPFGPAGRTRSGLRPWLVGLVLAAAAGCGPGRGELSGKVTYQGKDVRGGSVSVVGGDGIPRSAFIVEDGRYRVPDLPAGPVRVAVTSPDPGRAARPGKVGGPAPRADRAGWFPLPEKYADFATSGLTATLRPGANVLDLELE